MSRTIRDNMRKTTMLCLHYKSIRVFKNPNAVALVKSKNNTMAWARLER